MPRATVLALTSDFGGVPGVLGEALSVGIPVVATDSTRPRPGAGSATRYLALFDRLADLRRR